MNFKEYLAENSVISEKEKWAQDVDVKQGKMGQLLGLKKGEKVTDKYSSGEALANALLKANGGDRKKTASMLAFAANVDKTNNVLDAALKYMKKSDEK